MINTNQADMGQTPFAKVVDAQDAAANAGEQVDNE